MHSNSQTARLKRKSRMYARHLRNHPYDVGFKLLKIPDDIRMQDEKHRVSLEQKSFGTAQDRVLVDKDSSSTNRSSVSDTEALTGNCSDNERLADRNASEMSDEGTVGIAHDASDNEYSLGDNAQRQPDGHLRNETEDGETYEEEMVEEDNSSDGEESNTCMGEGVSGSTESESEHRVKKMFSINLQDKQWSLQTIFRQSLSRLHVILPFLSISLRGKLTYARTSMIFNTLKSMTVNSGIPGSMKSLWKMLTRDDDGNTTRHYYCRKCKGYMGFGKKPKLDCSCGECGPKKKKGKFMSYFIQVAIIPQLHQLLTDATVLKSLEYRFKREKKNLDAIEDIYDGIKYNEKCGHGGFLSKKYNFSFTVFTDGCSVSKSSKASAWPILLQINEFPPHARKRYTILAGIWVDTTHPDLNTLLLPTVKELQQLYRDGIAWIHPVNGKQITSKFITLIFTADSRARPDILNMTMFNGKYGCTFCRTEGRQLPGKRGRVYPVSYEVPHRRTNSEIRENMLEAHNTNQKVWGIKGLAAIAGITKLDLGSGIVVDSMHNLYLGVAKFHTELLLMGKSTDSWYAGGQRNISLINARLLEIRPPSKIARMPRVIDEIKVWKASEFRNWILYYAVSCLYGIIHPVDHKLLTLLSRAAFIFNKDSITTNELRSARQLLRSYVNKFEKRYGLFNMRYNVHLLTHLADSVENWGPFWTHSAFPFEAWNKKIIDKVTSTTSRPLQIVTRFLMIRFIESCLSNPAVPFETKKEIDLILTKELKKKKYIIDDSPIVSSKFIGVGFAKERTLRNSEKQALLVAGYQPKKITCYKRASIYGIDYKCRDKTNQGKRTRFSNEYVYCPTAEFGEILDIVTFHHNDDTVYGFILEHIAIVENAFRARHIANAERTGVRKFVNIADGLVPAIIVNTHKQLRLSRLSNIWETD